MKIRNSSDLATLAETGRRRMILDRPRIAVGLSSCGQAAGAGEVIEVFRAETDPSEIRLVSTGCLGFCGAEPLVDVSLPGLGRVLYGPIDPTQARRMIEDIRTGRLSADRIIGRLDPLDGREDPTVAELPALTDHPFYRGQVRHITRNLGLIDPDSLEEYAAVGGYQALMKALTSMTPDQIIAEMIRSGLRGRGGAGFPTGAKWEMTRKAGPSPRYLIMNGDEGDPGAYMDRSLMEGDPQAIIEGMVIGALAVGAEMGILYVRSEYPLAQQRLMTAIDQARQAGLLGHDILGSGFDFDLHLVSGAGAFVSGEETALIEALEGRMAEPRPRPPFPSESGFMGRPTCINNVETWANVPLIINNGAEWFHLRGNDRNRGTKLFCLVGEVARPGLVEVPLGTTLETIIQEIGGGGRDGLEVKAVQTGGPSGGCIPADLFHLPADYEHLKEMGSIMGSGGLVVMSAKTCLVDVARYFLGFTSDESCGKCTPCREGTEHLGRILDKITGGQGTLADLDRLKEISHGITLASLCGLGQTAPNPILTSLEYFRNEYEAHIVDGRCPAGVCRSLITYGIDADLCTGCGLCLRACPVAAIAGEKKEPHLLDAVKCVKCGACRETCAFGAIIVR